MLISTDQYMDNTEKYVQKLKEDWKKDHGEELSDEHARAVVADIMCLAHMAVDSWQKKQDEKRAKAEISD